MSRRYISFYLQGKFYELNLSAFNEIFSFPPSLDLSLRQVPCEFNSNVFGERFWGILILTQGYIKALSLGALVSGSTTYLFMWSFCSE